MSLNELINNVWKALTDHMELTESDVKNAQAKITPYKLSDGGGLYLLVQTNGTKLWEMDYQFGGKQKTLSMSEYPSMTLTQARSRREEAINDLARGLIP